MLAATSTLAGAEPPGMVVSTNLIDATRETADLALDWKLNASFALRGAVGYDTRRRHDNTNDTDYRGGVLAAVGVRGFLRDVYDGPFVDLEVQLRSFSIRGLCDGQDSLCPTVSFCDVSWTGLSPRLFVGWQLTLRVGLSIAAGIGVSHEEVSGDTYSVSDGVTLVGSARVGYAF
jgi:hypothetical protein